MPLFEFYCESCQKSFEELVFSEENPSCPLCQGLSSRCVAAPSPLKTGAFPYKVGPARPGMPRHASSCPSSCGSAGGCGSTCGA